MTDILVSWHTADHVLRPCELFLLKALLTDTDIGREF